MLKQISPSRPTASGTSLRLVSPSVVPSSVSGDALRPLSRSFSPLCRLDRTHAVRFLSKLYSSLLGEAVTPRFTLHLLHSQLSGLFLLLLSAADLLMQALSLIWFALALCGCRRYLSRGISRV